MKSPSSPPRRREHKVCGRGVVVLDGEDIERLVEPIQRLHYDEDDEDDDDDDDLEVDDDDDDCPIEGDADLSLLSVDDGGRGGDDNEEATDIEVRRLYWLEW